MRVLLLLALVGASASAQPLTITPSPFDASGTAPLVMRNATAAPVRLDSLRFGRSINGNGVGWTGGFSIDTPDGTSTGRFYCSITLGRGTSSPACGSGDEGFTGAQILPGGALTVESLVIICGFCSHAAGGIDDTLFVFTDGSATPQAVEILNGVFVAGEEAPATARLAVFPNLAARLVRLTLATSEASQVAVVDALGRTVARVVGARGVLNLDVSAWPPGIYTVRAEAGGRVETARLVVIR